MSLIHKILAGGVGLGLVWVIGHPIAHAQAVPAKPAIIFDSFSGTYYLSRDANNRSLLTSEEVILADFPGNGNFSGITRAIPQQYQGHSVQVKVLSVTDAAGTPVPFKTSPDKNGNLVVTSGDPAITVFGLQTIRINYQTRDVINLNTPQNQFLLDVNGRGWEQSIGKVTAVLHMPSSVSSSLSAKPSCYIGYLNTTTLDCSVNTKNTATETIITAKSTNQLAAHQTLVVKVSFKTATFTNKKGFWERWRDYIGVLAVVVIGGWYVAARRRTV